MVVDTEAVAEQVTKPQTRSREHRAAATTAGLLYIVGTVAGVLSKVVFLAPVSAVRS